MNRTPVHWEVSVTIASPFHIGGGKGISAVCGYLVRDAAGTPYWPGSAFKGKTRHYASLLYGNCDFVHQNTENTPAKDCGCIVCDMFGGAGNAPGHFAFGDLKPGGEIHTESRFGNAINRFRRTANDGSLFQIETAESYEKMTLMGSIDGSFSESVRVEQRKLLLAAIGCIFCIGGDTGRGLGWVAENGIVIHENGIQINKKWTEADADSPNAACADTKTNIDTETGMYAKTDTDAGHVTDADIENSVPDISGGDPDINVTCKVSFTLASPLLIGSRNTQSNFRATQRIIPGAVVRAGLAREIIRQDGGDHKNYLNYVTPDGGKGLYSTMREDFSSIRISQFLPGDRFMPLTAVKCKYACEPVYDTLATVLSGGYTEKCPSCGAYMERVKKSFSVETMVATKSSLNRYSGTARDEMLYSVEAITPNNNAYTGTISGRFYTAELRGLLAGGLRIGGYINSGYGWVKAEVTPIEPEQDDREKLRNRIAAFNELIDENEINIPITLLSDAITAFKMSVEDEFADESGFMLSYQNQFFQNIKDSVCVRAWTQHEQWRGFDTKERTNFLKDTQHIVKAGSVFVLQVDKLTDALLDDLLLLQRTGICSEPYANDGYGEVRVADEFHLKVMNRGTDINGK